ncbi:MAG: hypothetical protein Q9160_009156 [Pyrenula sp. 1 TL-2023]
MKSFILQASAATLLITSASAASPNCAWNCLGNWNAIFSAVAQICVNAGTTVSASQEATFSPTSGGTITGSWGPFITGVSTALPGAPSGWKSGGPWGGPGGKGGPGGHGGPWGPNDGSWTAWPSGLVGGSNGWGPWGNGQGPCWSDWSTWATAHGFTSSWTRTHTGTWGSCSTGSVVSTITTTATGSPSSAITAVIATGSGGTSTLPLQRAAASSTTGTAASSTDDSGSGSLGLSQLRPSGGLAVMALLGSTALGVAQVL